MAKILNHASDQPTRVNHAHISLISGGKGTEDCRMPDSRLVCQTNTFSVRYDDAAAAPLVVLQMQNASASRTMLAVQGIQGSMPAILRIETSPSLPTRQPCRSSPRG